MDRISGLMPQVGWSPLLSMVPPKKAPATTVEPASTSANTNSGLGAEVGSQTQNERVTQLQARDRDLAVETAVLAQSRAQAAPDPDAPTGPPPTFDVTPLEAKAAALMAVPPQEAETAATRPDTGTAAGPEEPAQPPADPAVTAEPQAQATPEAAPQPTPQPAPDWQATSDTAEPSLDVVR